MYESYSSHSKASRDSKSEKQIKHKHKDVEKEKEGDEKKGEGNYRMRPLPGENLEAKEVGSKQGVKFAYLSSEIVFEKHEVHLFTLLNR